MIKRIRKWLKNLFKKKLKPVNNPKVIELVAGGYFAAPDHYCVKIDQLTTPHKK